MYGIYTNVPCEKASIDGSKYLYEDIAQNGATGHSKAYDSIQTTSRGQKTLDR